jgi:heat shock protein HtpX
VVGHVIHRVVLKNERGQGPGFWITTIVAQLVLGVLASIIVMWFSRWREFRADAGGARLAGRDKMIGALQRLGSAVDQEPLPDQLQDSGSPVAAVSCAYS